MQRYEVIFYEKENGECPVEDFISAQDVKMRAKLVGLLEVLEEKGNRLREPYSKQLEDGILKFAVKWETILQGYCIFLLRGENSINQWFCQENTKNTAKGNKTSQSKKTGFC